MAGHTGLGDPEHGRELRDVQALGSQEPQHAEPGVVTEEPVERRGRLHIYKSTCVDVLWQGPGGAATESLRRQAGPAGLTLKALTALRQMTIMVTS